MHRLVHHGERREIDEGEKHRGGHGQPPSPWLLTQRQAQVAPNENTSTPQFQQLQPDGQIVSHGSLPPFRPLIANKAGSSDRPPTTPAIRPPAGLTVTSKSVPECKRDSPLFASHTRGPSGKRGVSLSFPCLASIVLQFLWNEP